MDENSKKELARIVGHDEDAEHLKKEVSVIVDKKQYSIRIPSKFAELAGLTKENRFEFTLVPLDEKGTKFTIEADLKRENE